MDVAAGSSGRQKEFRPIIMKSHQFSPFMFIEELSTSFSIPSEPDLIPMIASYVGGLFENSINTELSRSVELVMDEALSNAIFHGNLEVSSIIKEGNFSEFYEVAKRRSAQAPYCLRRTHVSLSFIKGRLEIKVRDEGNGFNWKQIADFKKEDSGCIFGRGLRIIHAMTSKMEFNDPGNEIILVFEGIKLCGAQNTEKSKQDKAKM